MLKVGPKEIRLRLGRNSSRPWGVTSGGWISRYQWSRVREYMEPVEVTTEMAFQDIEAAMWRKLQFANGRVLWEMNLREWKRHRVRRGGSDDSYLRFVAVMGERNLREWKFGDRLRAALLRPVAWVLNLTTGWYFYRRDMKSLARIRGMR